LVGDDFGENWNCFFADTAKCEQSQLGSHGIFLSRQLDKARDRWTRVCAKCGEGVCAGECKALGAVEAPLDNVCGLCRKDGAGKHDEIGLPSRRASILLDLFKEERDGFGASAFDGSVIFGGVSGVFGLGHKPVAEWLTINDGIGRPAVFEQKDYRAYSENRAGDNQQSSPHRRNFCTGAAQ
jgi:hypothetical protein